MEQRSIVLNITFQTALIDRWEHLEIRCDACDVTVRFGVQALRARTTHRVVSDMVAHLRCRICGAPPSAAYLIRILDDIDPLKPLPFRVEEWSLDGNRLYGIKAACESVTSGWAAYHVIVKDNPKTRLTYRVGAFLMASTHPETPPDPPSNVVPLPGRKVPVGHRRSHRRARVAPF